MSLKYLRRNLVFISSQAKDTTVITTDGEHIQTQRHLLSTSSPYLAALISQASQTDMLAISVPFSGEVARNLLHNLASEDEDCDEIEHDGLYAARELGIMFISKILTINEPSVKQEIENDNALREYSNSKMTNIDKPNIDFETQKASNVSYRFKERTKKKNKEKKKKKRRREEAVDSKEHKCNLCDLKFKCYSHLSDHNKTDHPGLKTFLCEQCVKGFSTARIRDMHITNIHAEKTFLCGHDGCGKVFSSIRNQNIHIDKMHSKDSIMQCPHCEKSFKYLSSHIKNVHAEEDESVTCEECGKSLKNKNYLSDHIKSHLPDELKREIREKKKEKHRCIQCGQGFVDTTRLKWHEASQHTGIKSFHCQQCTKSYFRSPHLKTHITSSHGA